MFKDVFNQKKVLITGNSGFKGSWLSLWLRNLGSEVHGISYLPPSDPNMFESLGIENKIESFHKLNIADNSTEVNKIINIINPDFIFHLAAQPLVSVSYQDPLFTIKTNVLGTANVLNSVKDLKGKRVSLDEPGSGTYVDAKLILESNGLSTSDVKAEALKGKAATDALRNGKVDAIFVVAGFPTGAIVELASAVDVKLVPIDGAGAKALTSKYGFFSQSPIPSGTYEGVDEVNTVAVGAQWFTSAKEDNELIYQITKALWNKESRKLMDVGHAKGKTITPDTALSGVGVPLHPGAEKFYKEAGLIN